MSSSSLLVFKDSQGNEDQYTLKLPQDMLTWRVDAFLDFLTQGHDSRTPAGYLAEPIEALHFEHLRLLVLKPEWTFNRLLGFSQQGRQLGPADSFDDGTSCLHQFENTPACWPCTLVLQFDIQPSFSPT